MAYGIWSSAAFACPKKAGAHLRCFCRALTLLKSLCLVGSHWARRDRAGIEGEREREAAAVGFIKSARQAGNPLHSMRRPFHSRIAVTFFFPVKSEKRQVGKAVGRTKRYPVVRLMYRFNTMYLFPHRMLNNCGTIAIITNGLPNIPLL